MAYPCSRLIRSARLGSTCSPTAKSLVICSPPSGITDKYCKSPPSKIATPVVAAPISIRATPLSRCCGVNTTRAAASTGGANEFKASSTVSKVFSIVVTCGCKAETTYPFISSRLPTISIGSFTPPWPLTVNWCDTVSRILRFSGTIPTAALCSRR